MKRESTWVIIIAIALAVALCGTAFAQATVADILAKMPAQTVEEGQALFADLAKLGPPAIAEIAKLLVPTGAGDDNAARFALSGLAKYASRARESANRAMVEQALLNAIAAASDREVSAFLMCQLEGVATDNAVGPLSAHLSDEALCEPATQTLLAIGTPAAADVLVYALPTARGNDRVTIVKALGELRAVGAVPDLEEDASSLDNNLRQAVLFALANIGEISSTRILARAADIPAPFDERAENTAYLLLYARRLAEAGFTFRGERICRKLIETRTDPRESGVQCAALATLAAIKGKGVLRDLLFTMDSADPELRASALQLALAVPGSEATEAWVRRFSEVGTAPQIQMLGMLAKRNDPAALPAVLAATESPDLGLRLAAIDATARFDAEPCLPQLLKRIATAENETEIKAIQSAILRLSGEGVVVAVAAAVPPAPAAPRKALLEILGKRRATGQIETAYAQAADADESTRIAALKSLASIVGEADAARAVNLLLNAKTDAEIAAARETAVAAANEIADTELRAAAVLTAFANAPADTQPRLLAALTGIGGAKALETAIAATGAADAVVREAAIRALADWPDPAALAALLDIAKNTTEETLHVIALRGHIRLTGTDAVAADRKTALYAEAIAAARRPDERKRVLGGLSALHTIDALNLVAPCLDDEALKTEAAGVAAKIALPQNENDKGLLAPEAAPILQKALAAIDNEELRKKIETHIAVIAPPAK